MGRAPRGWLDQEETSLYRTCIRRWKVTFGRKVKGINEAFVKIVQEAEEGSAKSADKEGAVGRRRKHKRT